jgi:hypothetical protein
VSLTIPSLSTMVPGWVQISMTAPLFAPPTTSRSVLYNSP